jgi:hypothetical protein
MITGQLKQWRDAEDYDRGSWGVIAMRRVITQRMRLEVRYLCPGGRSKLQAL